MKDRELLEKVASPKLLIPLVSGIFFVSIFIANFILSFFQEILQAIQSFADNPTSVDFTLDWQSFLNFQYELIGFYLGFYIVLVIGVLKFVYNMRSNYKTLDEGQHGTSQFEKVKELKKQYKMIPALKDEYKGSGGVIISGLQEKWKPYKLLIDEGPIHTMVIGITRSGKGETFVFPMLDVLSRATDKPSLIVNDPKGELAAASYNTLLARGYEVHVFNLIQQHMSMGFNPLQLVIDAWKKGNTSLAQQYANSVAFSLYNDANAKDPFWSNSAKSLVTAIILAITEDTIKSGKEEKVTMYSVANFLSSLGSENDEEGNNALDLFFQSRDETNAARMMYATSNFAAGNTRASIFSVAMDKLQIFTLEPNAKLTSYNNVDLASVGFGDKPVAIFLVTPDFDQSNHVLASIFISQLYRVNAEKATMSPNGKMKRHVHFLLDEFGNMPTIEGMAGMVTVGAGRGFRFHLIVQAYSQIKSQYGEESDTIIGNCSNQIYILTKDKSTAEQYSALIGTKTITDVSRSGKIFATDKSHNESVKERPLIMPDELMQLKEGESVVVRANKRQDNKRRKIVPKPIFNKGVTASKFRWEYLADYFDNSNSILDLPLLSNTYHDLDLSSMVFTARSIEDQFIPMFDVLGKQDFMELKKLIRTALISAEEEFDYDAELERWSMHHFMSYLVFASNFNPSFINTVTNKLKKYLPDNVMTEWQDIYKLQVEKRNEVIKTRRREEIDKDEEDEERAEGVSVREELANRARKGAIGE